MNIAQKIKDGTDDLTAAIDDCSKGATANAVHRVRTRCRRLEAVISAMLATHPVGAAELHEVGAAVVRRLKKIRRGAGAVRDLDIHLSLIEVIAGQSPDDSAKALHKELTRERKRAADVMLETTDKHRKKMEKRAADFLKVVEGLPVRERQVETASLAMAGFLEASAAMPELREDNLHEFRKRSKAARYVAEINLRSPASARLAKKLNQIQDAIGVWHDWAVLEEEAGEILHGKGRGLQGTLHEKQTKSYRTALASARRIQRQLLRRG